MGQIIQKLADFAFIPKGLEDYKAKLVEMAQAEDWGKPYENWKHPVLWNYLEHTFSKLYNDNKIAFTSDNQYCSFNTGLLTPYDNNIYAIFQKNTRKQAKSPWVARGFCKDSDHFLQSYCNGKLPERADYFTEPAKLIYNPKKSIKISYEHIIDDNKDRFPLDLQNKSQEEMQIYLSGVIEKIKKRLICNYKIAVPEYYMGTIQLLIPLHLTQGSPNPDLALTICENEYNYTASTCLTISMAYNNARLIVKPQSDWLKL